MYLKDKCGEFIQAKMNEINHLNYLLLFQDFLLKYVTTIEMDEQDGMLGTFIEKMSKLQALNFSNRPAIISIKKFIKHLLEDPFNIRHSSLIVGLLELAFKLLEEN